MSRCIYNGYNGRSGNLAFKVAAVIKVSTYEPIQRSKE